MRLNRNTKAKWVKALRSGKFVQGNGQLEEVVDGQTRHCCLGVLKVVANPKLATDTAFLRTGKFGPCQLLPYGVQDELAQLNDDGVPFEVIAGLINVAL